MRSIFYIYQRAMFYFGIAVAEAKKPLILLNETALLSILARLMGVRFSIGTLILAYTIIAGLCIVAGKILVVTDVVKFNAHLNNEQNPQLMEILETIRKK